MDDKLVVIGILATGEDWDGVQSNKTLVGIWSVSYDAKS